ncbi:hypothetical protein [Streptomyces sp. TLI_171]|uniref:hypothetical protein n=1 Tax=Streptomyces sp. TLI_171 TaxID=1938859 RepID=UPI00117E2236|nr:hypothetical protein [Streptomyces sp. TLI_171]
MPRMISHPVPTAARRSRTRHCRPGPAGVEAAAAIAESHPGRSVTLIGTEQPGATTGAGAAAPTSAAHWTGWRLHGPPAA